MVDDAKETTLYVGELVVQINWDSILTDDTELLDAAIGQFDNVWMGTFCKECGRRSYCSDLIK